jgi:GNAT superfamily N-acetyltransferase
LTSWPFRRAIERMALWVREATIADYGVFARLFPALEVPDPLLTAAQFEERMLPHVVIAGESEHALGYAHWRFYGATAHVVHVVVDAHGRRRGVGHLLMGEVRRRAVAKGAARLYLHVKADNAPAIRLYERTGLSVEQRGWSMRAEWAALRGLPGSTTPRRFEPSADEASRFARQHGMDPERLALVRARPGVVLVALRDEAGPCALAVFDPALPGISPIAAARPEHARPLFDALVAHARDPHVHVSVEGHAALAQALREAGASLTFEFLRMASSLP